MTKKQKQEKNISQQTIFVDYLRNRLTTRIIIELLYRADGTPKIHYENVNIMSILTMWSKKNFQHRRLRATVMKAYTYIDTQII